MRFSDQQALGLQTFDCVPDGCPADAQLFGQTLLGNMFPGFKFSLYNCIFNPKIDGIGNGGVLDKRLLFAHELGLLCFSNKSNNNYTLKNTKSQ